jgi:hypothetical protein
MLPRLIAVLLGLLRTLYFDTWRALSPYRATKVPGMQS